MISLNGKELASKRATILEEKIAKLPLQPKLVIVRIGEDFASGVFIEKKKEFGRKIGAEVVVLSIPAEVTKEELKEKIDVLNKDITVHGIIIQLPIPENLNKDKCEIINSIKPEKDVDGLTGVSLWRLLNKEIGVISPATAKGVETILDENNIDVLGKNIVIVGDSLLVGRPLGILLLNRKATVTLCHSKTKNLSDVTRQADILIVAVGKAGLITNNYVKEGAVVIDIGINKKEGEKGVVGDVDFESVKDLVSAITPVPGGVGPMTVLSLFENLVRVTEERFERSRIK